MPQFAHTFRQLLLCLAALAVCATSQAIEPAQTDYRCAVYQCYVASNTAKWRHVIGQMEQEYRQRPSDQLLGSIIESQYGYIPWAINRGDSKDAAQMLRSAFGNLGIYLKRHPNDAKFIAIKSSLLGFSIAISPLKAPVLGPQALSLISKAMKIAPNHSWVMLEKANDELYIPTLLGGDPKAAAARYLRCIAQFEKQGTACNWAYLNAQVNLAYCYIKLKEYDKAMAVYRKMLAFEPSFGWVRSHLIPSLQRKMAQ